MGMIKDNLPKVVHDDLDKRMETCLHPNTSKIAIYNFIFLLTKNVIHNLRRRSKLKFPLSAEIIDPTDDSCTTYLPMMMCVHVAFMEVHDIKLVTKLYLY